MTYPILQRSLILVAFLSFAASVYAEDYDYTKSISWLASGDASANFSMESSGLSTSLEGTHQEIALWQDKNPFTNIFTGLHYINLEFDGQGTTQNGEALSIEYQNQSLFFSLGFDFYLAELIHIQPYAAYAYGNITHSSSQTSASGVVTPYEEKSELADMGLYGVNLLLEITPKLWLGYSMNYFAENQVIKYDSGEAKLEPQSSQTLMLVWNWERVDFGSSNWNVD